MVGRNERTRGGRSRHGKEGFEERLDKICPKGLSAGWDLRCGFCCSLSELHVHMSLI